MENQTTQQPATNTTLSSLSSAAINNLKKTAPWMTFISVLGFIGAGFMILGALSLFILMSISSMFAILGIFYLVIGAVLILVYYYLIQTAGNYQRYCDLNTPEALEKAFLMQRKYWQTIGIITIVTIVLVILSVIIYAAFLPTLMSNFPNLPS